MKQREVEYRNKVDATGKGGMPPVFQVMLCSPEQLRNAHTMSSQCLEELLDKDLYMKQQCSSYLSQAHY